MFGILCASLVLCTFMRVFGIANFVILGEGLRHFGAQESFEWIGGWASRRTVVHMLEFRPAYELL